MSLPKLTPTDLDTLAFKRFKAVFGLFGASALKDDPTTFTAEWLRVLKWSYPDEVKRGVNLWIGSGKDKWPTPGQLYGVIADSRPTRARVDAPDYEPPSDWFAFPVKPSDVNGPRYRLFPVDEGQLKGLALVGQVSCPEEGCGCEAVEVLLSPQDHGLSSHFFRKVLQESRPTGWRWNHYALAHKMTPV